ncbi:MAG TPA: hypothetical protein VFV44_04250 [Nitrospiraceae bacterium]|nr:hypothetical protein [Nitrospiraceae bacterium]
MRAQLEQRGAVAFAVVIFIALVIAVWCSPGGPLDPGGKGRSSVPPHPEKRN